MRKFSTGLADAPESNGQPTTDPDFDRAHAEARPVALQACRLALSNWRAARELLTAARRIYDASPSSVAGERTPDTTEWEAWLAVLSGLENSAEQSACECVLTVHGRIERPSHMRSLPDDWRPVALELDGEILVVAPWDADSDVSAPRLHVVAAEDFSSSQDGVGPDWPV